MVATDSSLSIFWSWLDKCNSLVWFAINHCSRRIHIVGITEHANTSGFTGLVFQSEKTMKSEWDGLRFHKKRGTDDKKESRHGGEHHAVENWLRSRTTRLDATISEALVDHERKIPWEDHA